VKEEISFEKAFERLEEILQKMNDGKVSLDTSLKLFEEADNLISNCSEKLSKAEQKIEMLMKNRGELELENDQPKTKPFEYDKEKVLEN
jgi:exodeoxyribonuclease VII small subunit